MRARGCTTVANGDGTISVACPDGTSATSQSCSTAANGDGTITVTCPDGTSTTTSSDQSCTVADNMDGTVTISCDDGTSWTQEPGCTTQIHEESSYSLVAVSCPGTSPVIFGTRRVPTLVPQIVGGLFLSCGLKDDAFAHCWGPGTGGLNPSHGSFVQVDTYGNHSCGLRAEGYVSCVGANGAGQTAAPQGEVFVQITTGESHTCGLYPDGTARCWGNPADGRTTVPAGEKFVFLDTFGTRTCGLRDDASIMCWGEDLNGRNAPQPSQRFVQIALGGTFTCGLRFDGTTHCWGDSSFGQTTPPSGEVFTEISAGALHACGLRPNGTAVCWGRNASGQTSAPANSSFVQITSGLHMNCGLKADGTAECWGDSSTGMLNPGLPFVCAPGSAQGGATAGLFYRLWTNTSVTSLPPLPGSVFGAPTQTGVVPKVEIPTTGDNFVMTWNGWMNVPSDRTDYWFRISSDDGSRVFLGDEEIINNDGVHGPTPRRGGRVCLDAGWHEVRVSYFEQGGAETILFERSDDGGATYSEVPAADFSH